MPFCLLQVGLAVGDTETMKKCATIKRLEMQLQYQFEIEEAYPSFITRRAYQTVYVEKPNRLMLSMYNRYVCVLKTQPTTAYSISIRYATVSLSMMFFRDLHGLLQTPKFKICYIQQYTSQSVKLQLTTFTIMINTNFQISVIFQSEQSFELGPSNKIRKVPWHSILILIIADVMKVVINIFLDAVVAKYSILVSLFHQMNAE